MGVDFANSTRLDSTRLYDTFVRHTWPYAHDRLTVRVRYSRGAAFSGACHYATGRLLINLGRRNHYPYALGTHVARACSNRTHWWRETYRLILADAHQLVLFVYLHELYHWLIHAAGRNPRRKESLCDRFAARVLVDEYGAPLLDRAGRPVPRTAWDIKDVHAFVAGAPRVASGTPCHFPPVAAPPAGRPIPVRIRGLASRGVAEEGRLRADPPSR